MNIKGRPILNTNTIAILGVILLLLGIAPLIPWTIQAEPERNEQGKVEVIYSLPGGEVSIWDKGSRGFVTVDLNDIQMLDFTQTLQEHPHYSIEKQYRVPLLKILMGEDFEESQTYLYRVKVNVPREKIEFRTIAIS